MVNGVITNEQYMWGGQSWKSLKVFEFNWKLKMFFQILEISAFKSWTVMLVIFEQLLELGIVINVMVSVYIARQREVPLMRWVC